MDENNENVEQDVDAGQTTPSDLGAQERRPKNKLKNAGKKAAKNISDAFKQGMKNLWAAMPIKGKLIIAGVVGVVVFLAATYIVYADYFMDASEETITDYYTDPSNTTKAAETYKSTGSLLYATNDDIKNISKNFLEDVKPRNNTLYDFMSKKYKNGDPDNSGVPLKNTIFGDDALNINANKTLYEHLLNAERYNFNKIKWKKYNRDVDEGLIPTSEMEVDSETELQYPKDQKGTTLDEFANSVRPYLQSWVIPYGLFSGLLSDGTGNTNLEYGQFAYQILIKGYHEIEMGQYNLQIETVNSTQNVYDRLKYTVERTITKTKGSDNVVTVRVYTNYVPNSSTGKDYTVVESCHQDAKVESAPVITNEVTYKLISAKMFDRIITNTNVVQKYNKSVDTPEHYISREPYISGEKSKEELKALDDKTFFTDEQLEDMKNSETGSWTGTKKYSYEVKKGYTQNETRTWRDKVETTASEDRVLKTLDVENYIEPEKLTGDEKKYYNSLAVEENVETVRMTIVDIINAKKDVYSTYLKKDANYSDNIGYPRSWLVFSYDALKNYVRDVEESDTGWNYLYGASLGLNITVSKPPMNNVNGDYAIIRNFNADTVVNAMETVYSQYNLKDRHGTTWDTLPFYPANADYAWTHWKDYVTDVAADYGVDPLWVLAKMSFESRGGQISGWTDGANAGPMQINKDTHLDKVMEAYNVKTGKTDKIVMTRENLSDDKTNIKIGIMYYSNLLKECGGNPYLAAQKYNYGNIGFVSSYADRTGKNKDTVISDLEDVGWVYDAMEYHTSKKTGDGYYAYRFALYLAYLKTK